MLARTSKINTQPTKSWPNLILSSKERERKRATGVFIFSSEEYSSATKIEARYLQTAIFTTVGYNVIFPCPVNDIWTPY